MDSVFSKMPILNSVSSLWPDVFLDRVVIIGAQHLMESTLWMFKFLASRGLKMRHVFLIGKCYSTSREIASELSGLGITISPCSWSYDSTTSFDQNYELNVRDFLTASLQQIKEISCDHLILLDDGGVLIAEFNKILKKTRKLLPPNIAGIEQTSSGFRKLFNTPIPFPIYNVARSFGKLTRETPYITRSCLERIKKKIDLSSFEKKNALILGRGVVGQSIHQELLLRNINTKIIDVFFSQDILSARDLEEADLIIGATGFISVQAALHERLKKGVTLVSVSSSDREFDAVHLRRYSSDCLTPWKDLNVHDINLLNSGFPINFFGSRNNMPLEWIQITMGLLSGSLLDAVSKCPSSNGFVFFSPDKEIKIINDFDALIKDEGKFLHSSWDQCCIPAAPLPDILQFIPSKKRSQFLAAS